MAKKKVFVDETTNETMDIQQAELSEPISMKEFAEQLEIVDEPVVDGEIQSIDNLEQVASPEVTEPVNTSPRRYTPPVVEKENTPTIQYGRNGRTSISHEEANRMG